MIGLFILGALVLYLAFSVWIVKRQKTKRAKWVAITILVLIPMWDQILGRTYFYTLCAMEGGNRIFSTVTIPSEYFNAEGHPKLVLSKKPGALLEIPDRYIAYRETMTVSNVFRVEKIVISIRDVTQEKLLGTRTYFLYFGGWVSFSAHRTGNFCPSSSIDGDQGFYSAVFQKAAQ